MTLRSHFKAFISTTTKHLQTLNLQLIEVVFSFFFNIFKLKDYKKTNK